MAVSNALLADIEFNQIWRNASYSQAINLLYEEGYVGSIPSDIPHDLRPPALLDWLFYNEGEFATDGELRSNGNPNSGYTGSTSTGLDYTRSLLLNSKKPFTVLAELTSTYNADKAAFCAQYFPDSDVLSWIGLSYPSTNTTDPASNFTAYTWTNDTTITANYPKLKYHIPLFNGLSSYIGSVTSGTLGTTTFSTTLAQTSPSGMHVGNAIAFTYGPNADVVRTITEFNASGGLVTVDTPLPFTPTAGDRFFCPTPAAAIKTSTDAQDEGYRYITLASAGLGGATAQLANVNVVPQTNFGSFFDVQFTPFYIGKITNATNSGGLIQLTISGPHGLATGACVIVTGVGGVTAANGTWFITVVDSTSFTLDGSTFAGTYTSGGSYHQPDGIFMDRFAAIMPSVHAIWWAKYQSIGGLCDGISFDSEMSRAVWQFTGLKEFQALVADPRVADLAPVLGFDTTDATLWMTLYNNFRTDLRSLLFQTWSNYYVGEKVRPIAETVKQYFPDAITFYYDELGRNCPGTYLGIDSAVRFTPVFGCETLVADYTSASPYGYNYSSRWDWSANTGNGANVASGCGTSTINNCNLWNSFLYDMGRCKMMDVATTAGKWHWVDRKSDNPVPTVANYYTTNLYYDLIFHLIMSNANIAYFASFSNGASDNNAMQNALIEAQSVVAWSPIIPVLLDPPGWDEPYLYSIVDCGGRYVWRITPAYGATVSYSTDSLGVLTFDIDGETITIPGGVVVTPSNPLGTGYWVYQYPIDKMGAILNTVKQKLIDDGVSQSVWLKVEPTEITKYPPGLDFVCVGPGEQAPDNQTGGGRNTVYLDNQLRVVCWKQLNTDQVGHDDNFLADYQGVFNLVNKVIGSLEQYYPQGAGGYLTVQPIRVVSVAKPQLVDRGSPKWGYVETIWSVPYKPGITP